MKYICALGFIVLLNTNIRAQWNTLATLEPKPSFTTSIPQYDYRSNPAVIWSEDFASGVPSDWQLEDLSGICPWVYSIDGSFGFFSLGDTAFAGPAIPSTSSANGFLINDPDSANIFTYGLPFDSTYQYLESYITTSAIDLSNNSNVRLEFEHVFRYSDSTELEIRVSNDSINWYSWHVANSASSLDLVSTSIDISSVAGGEQTVYLKFGWRTRNYFWMIDDLRIVEIPNYDKTISRTVISHTGDDYQYARIRHNQLGDSILIGMAVVNRGLLAQNNVQMNASIANGSGSFSISENNYDSLLVAGDTSQFFTHRTATGLQDDLFNAIFTLTANQDSLDATLSNDSILRAFEVGSFNDDYLSLDGIGIHPSPIVSTIGTATFPDGADGLILLSKLKFTNDFVCGSVQMAISANTIPGGEVVFAIHDAADVAAGDVFNVLAITPTVPVQQWNVANGLISGDFGVPFNATSGDYYVSVTMNSFGGLHPIEVLDDLTIPQPSDAGLMYIATGHQPGIFDNGNAPAIRVNSFVNGIEEEETLNFFVSPNPSAGMFRISSPKTELLTIEVRNTLGQLIYNNLFLKDITIDLGAKATGIKIIRVSNGSTSMTKRVAIQ